MTPGTRHEAVRGVGLGLRSCHYSELMADAGGVPWLEVLVDNYAHGDGLPLQSLESIAERYPLVFHGVGMSLGSADPLDPEYLDAVMVLVDRFEPAWISEHLAWTSSGGRHHHELLPLPFIDESVRALAEHIREVQDRLGARMLVENSSGYAAFRDSEMSELEFVGRVLASADCLLLLDVNNLYVNAWNHGFDAIEFLRGLPAERVAQMHLAGHDDHGHYLIDAHGTPVVEPVWELFAEAVRLFPGVPISLEWDRDIPPLGILLGEMQKANAIMTNAQAITGEATFHAP